MFRLPAEAGGFYPLQNLQSGTGANTSPYSMDIVGSLLGPKMTETVHPHLVPKLRVNGAQFAHPHTPSCCVQGKTL
jgi:hypothetical protein